MQTSMQTTRPLAVVQRGARVGCSRRTVVVRASQGSEFIKDLAKNAALTAAALALTMAPVLDVEAKTTTRERELAYQQSMVDAIKARGGAALPTLKASPKERASAENKPLAPLNFGEVKKVKVEVPDNVPTPEPAVPATATPPKAYVPAPAAAASKPAAASASIFDTPAPKPVAAAPTAAPSRSFGTPAPAATSSASTGDNKNVLAVVAIAVVGAGVAVASNGNSEEGAAAPVAASGSAPATAGASDVPANVAEARAWIGAWKKKHGKN